MQIHGRIVDIHRREVFPGTITVEDGRIAAITRDPSVTEQRYLLPGFVDAHVHIESSLLAPSEFARLATPHGTVATVSDPHEIANVCGMEGIRFMLENAETVPLKVAFGAPSCVPATSFETAGAEITVADLQELFSDPRIRYLSEMMNWPGVLQADPLVMEKLRVAKDAGRVIDGHAPGLKGADASAYAAHGITTDHECFTLDEALDKIAAGMKILIREGSAARNYEALHPLIGSHPDNVMFCCDDAHPDLLTEGHIDRHVRHSVERGYDVFDVLRIASLHPVEHYGLPVGLLRVGDPADFIVVDDLYRFDVLETWINGRCVAAHGEALFDRVTIKPINQFKTNEIKEHDLQVETPTGTVRVIVAHDGQLVTSEEHGSPTDPDVRKLVVVNRYASAPPAVAYVKGFSLAQGALASSVAHDSHNIVAVGVSDAEIVLAINAVIASTGGLAVALGHHTEVLPLPLAGLMSDQPGEVVAKQYIHLDRRAKELGSHLRAPFMTLSFMALLVIPQLKLSDKGLFDGQHFQFVSLSV